MWIKPYHPLGNVHTNTIPPAKSQDQIMGMDDLPEAESFLHEIHWTNAHVLTGYIQLVYVKVFVGLNVQIFDYL